ncbi:MAG TPA: DnaB-like helicase N-terminal domain-containing protein [Actinomycetes bacterium]|nr:DnaB-like helicase N-terminal domain-containing protein [Actinomycetes bacterium]
MPANDHHQPPRNPDAEAAVLGAMLLDTAALERALVTLDAGDFYNPTHRLIFTACAHLEAASQPVDPVTVAAHLAAAGQLEQIGGATYLHDLLEAVPTIAQTATYLDLVAQAAAARRLIDVGHRITQLGHEQGLDPDKAQQIAAELLEQVGNARPHALVRDRRLQEAPVFIFDPFADLPAIWGDGQEVAWPSGESLVIAGPQGVGKSTLAQRLTLARIGVGPATLLGMPVAPTASRVLYLACDRPGQIARSMRRMVTEEDRVTLAERLMVWRGPPPVDLAKEPRALLSLARNADADTVVIDSLKDAALDLVKDEVGARYNQARQICLTEGIDLLELHHQRKAAADNKRPRKLDDVYGSNWLTAGAGSVLLLWGEPGDPIVELSHLKQPVEEIGPMKLLHDAETGGISVQQGVDLLTLVRTQPGLTAADAARLLFDVEGRSAEPKEVEKARRRLDSLVRRGLVKQQPGTRGRVGGAINPATYHPVVDLDAP